MVTALIATWCVFTALALVGAIASRRLRSSPLRRTALASGLLLALPCIVFAVYYLHWWTEPVLLYRFRAVPGSELAAGLSGFLVGWCALWLTADRRLAVRMTSGLLLVFPLLLMIPYLKPLLSPLDLDHLQDRWRDDVCLQTSGSTCGPSCAATLLKAAGHTMSERDLAAAAHTTASGTECWYLVRAMRDAGLAVSMVTTGPYPQRMPYPAIAGTRIGNQDGVGHFVTILGENARGYVIGDPLLGRLTVAFDDLGKNKNKWFTGFFITVDGPAR